MNSDDILYVCLLLFTTFVGPLIRRIRNVERRKMISSIIGFGIVIGVSGVHFIHPVVVTLVNGVILFLVNKRYSHKASFAFCFAYLALVRSLHILGIIAKPVSQHLNAIQMLHALKMVGLAYEMRDTSLKRASENEADILELKCTQVDPSFMDLVHYSFCYIGLLTGPYFSFRTYTNWLYKPFTQYASSNMHNVYLKKLKLVPVFVALHLITNHFFPLEFAKSEIYSYSFAYRWWYMNPIFWNFRLRLYIAFLLAECSCISAGFGLYPASTKPKPGKGPTNFESLIESEGKDPEEMKDELFTDETINNSLISRVEFAPTIRETIKCWNMTIQYWFAVHVYKRVKNLRTITTLLVSAFWHGVSPGYYLCFLCVPFTMLAEDSLFRALKRESNQGSLTISDWICFLFKTQVFAYLGMSFFLLQIEDAFRYWSSLYFSGHILIVVVYLLGVFVTQQRKTARKLLNSD